MRRSIAHVTIRTLVSTDDDIDRAAILARRQQFMLMAIAGLASGCRPEPVLEPAAETPPQCDTLAAELGSAPDPSLAEDYYYLGLRAIQRGCHALAIEAFRFFHALEPKAYAWHFYSVGLSAYEAGDHRSAHEALTLFVEHSKRQHAAANSLRYARRLIQDLEDGLAWEQTRPQPRVPAPQVCLSRRGM
jgi:hypothetical protein